MAMGSITKSSRGGGRRRRQGAGFSEINVTPMVDVMLVLLIIFMVAAPMLTVGVPVDLPKTKAAKMNDQVEPIVVSVNAAGQTFLQETAVEDQSLIARLMAITANNPEARIYVRGDQKLAYGRIMDVMGEIAAAGFTKVSLIAEMPMGTTRSANPASQSLGTPKKAGPQSPASRPVNPPHPRTVPTLQQLVPAPAPQAGPQAAPQPSQPMNRQPGQKPGRG
jgi:biopolymer transport protein TolR